MLLNFVILISFVPTFALFKCYTNFVNDRYCKEFFDGNGLELPLTESALRYLQIDTSNFPQNLVNLPKRQLLDTFHYLVSDMLSWRRRRPYRLPKILDNTYGNHTKADKPFHVNSALVTLQAFLNIVSIAIRIAFVLFVVFCVHRFVLIVVKKYNTKIVPNYQQDLLKRTNLSARDKDAKKKQLLSDFQTVARYLQTDCNLSLEDPLYIQAFGNLFEYFLPERGQSIQDAFPLDFLKDPQVDETTWLKLVLEGLIPSYRLTILSAEERKLAKDAEKKKADHVGTGGGDVP